MVWLLGCVGELGDAADMTLAIRGVSSTTRTHRALNIASIPFAFRSSSTTSTTSTTSKTLIAIRFF